MRMNISEIVSMNIHLLCHMHIIYGMKYQILNEKNGEENNQKEYN